MKKGICLDHRAKGAMAALLLVLPLHALAAGCPAFIQNKQIKCPQQKNAGLQDACEQANRDIQEAYKIASQACAKIGAIAGGAAKAPGAKQTDNDANSDAMNAGSSQAAQQAAATLQQKNSQLEQSQQTLISKAQQGADLAQQPTFRRRFHGLAVLTSVLTEAQKFQQLSPSTDIGSSTVSGLDPQQSPLLAEQAQTYKEIADARLAIQNEANKLASQSSELSKNAKTSGDRKNGLDTQKPEGGGGGMPGGGGSPQSSSSPSNTSGSPSENAATGNLDSKLAQNDAPTDTNSNSGASQESKSINGVGLTGSAARTSGSRRGKADSSSTSSSSTSGSSGYTGLAGAGSEERNTGEKSGEAGSPLRDSLRSQLAKLGLGAGGGAGGTGSGSGKGAEDSDKEHAGKDGVAGSAEGPGGSGGYGGGDDALQPFGKSLGDPKLALAGSETDESVKNMMKDFEDEGDRGPASLSQGSDIGEREGPTLFERLRSVHERCMKRGLVSSAAKTKI